MNKHKKIAVLLAAYNGGEWLRDQIFSIQSQQGVDVTIYVSVDQSGDGSEQLVTELALLDPRIKLLPFGQRFGSAAKNFYRLICDVDFSEFDYLAFADQDDVWNVDKLRSHVALLESSEAEGVSSNVIAFWPDGRQKLIVKSQPRQCYDYLFESAGPGCTFLMTPWLVNKVKHQLLNNEAAKEVAMHDWLTYAICRAHERRWVIDSVPSMRYRQHQNNVVGANSGLKAIVARVKKINDGWYRHEVALIACVVASINPDEKLSIFRSVIQRRSILNQSRLMAYAIRGRRKLIDRLFLMWSILFFVF